MKQEKCQASITHLGKSRLGVMDSTKSKSSSSSQSAKKSFLNLGNLGLNLLLAIHRFFTFPSDYYQRARIKPEHLAEAGFYMAADYKSLNCHFCELKITSLAEWKDLDIHGMLHKHRTESPNCRLTNASNENVPLGDPSRILNFKYEAHRLFSLLRAGNIWKNVTPYDLSQNGFYYAGDDDNARCTFCNLEVRGWEPGDSAENEHKRWNPNCVLFTEPQSAGNIKIGEEVTGNIGSDCCAPNAVARIPSATSKYGVKVRGNSSFFSESFLGIYDSEVPKYSTYASRLERLNSFKGWPRSITQRPQQLAEAGFFYTGTGDRVLCFHCGTGLKDWDTADMPLEQHVKWSPSCPYLLMTKGAQFVGQSLQRKNTIETDCVPMEVEQARSDSLNCQYCEKNECAVSLPCGHMTTCVECFETTKQDCGKCGQFVSACLKVFLN